MVRPFDPPHQALIDSLGDVRTVNSNLSNMLGGFLWGEDILDNNLFCMRLLVSVRNTNERE